MVGVDCIRLAWLPLLISIFSLSACVSTPPDFTQEQIAQLANPAPARLAKVEERYALALRDVLRAEAIALTSGRVLDEQEIADARAVGVQHPKRIRLYITDELTYFSKDQSKLMRYPKSVGGITRNYGIFVRPKYEKARWLIVHEFVHVAQFERWGVEGMVRRSLLEQIIANGHLLPIEREAISVSEAYLGDEAPRFSY